MHYKKPTFWVSVAALAAVAALCIGLVVNRAPDPGARGDAMEGIWVVGTPPLDEAPVVYQYYFALPAAYRGKVTFNTAGPTYDSKLFEVYHDASVALWPEAGFLFRIVQHTPAEFEDYWPGQDNVGGVVHFAKNDDYYFSCETPPDVQTAPEVRGEYETLSAWQDTILGWFIEDNGLMPYDHYATVYAPEYTYPGEHAFYQITLGSGDAFTAVLSRPVRQGEGGIWCVERMIQDNGNVHYAMPDTDLTAAEYYAQLQAEADAGTAPEWLFDPAAVGQEYFDRVWGWYPVHIKEAKLNGNPASPADAAAARTPRHYPFAAVSPGENAAETGHGNSIVNLPEELYQIDTRAYANKLYHDFAVTQPTVFTIDVQLDIGRFSLGIWDKVAQAYVYELRAFGTETDTVTLEKGQYSIVIEKSDYAGVYHVTGVPAS